MTQEKIRSAGIRKPGKLLVGLDTAGIAAQAKSTELASTYRTYVREWIVESRHDTPEDALREATKKYGGRLLAAHVIVEPPTERSARHTLLVKRWNVDSEWKHEIHAESAAVVLREGDQDPDDVQVVVRNSKAEHALKAYGVLKLPASADSLPE